MNMLLLGSYSDLKIVSTEAYLLAFWLCGTSPSDYGRSCESWINGEHGILVF